MSTSIKVQPKKGQIILALTLILVALLPQWDLRSGFNRTFLYKDSFLQRFNSIDIAIFLICFALYVSRSSTFYIPRLQPTIRKWILFSLIVVFFSVIRSFVVGNMNVFYYFRPLVYFVAAFFIFQHLVHSNVEKDYVELLMAKWFSISLIFQSALLYGFSYARLPGAALGFLSLYFIVVSLSAKRESVVRVFSISGNLGRLIHLFNLVLYLILAQTRTVWMTLPVLLCLFILFVPSRIRQSNVTMKRVFRATFLFVFFSILLIFSIESLRNRLLSGIFFTQDAREFGTGLDNAELIKDFFTALEINLQNPFLGYGIGATHSVVGFSYKVTTVGFHNSLMTVWNWFGLLGLLAWIVLPILLLVTSRRDLVSSGHSSERWIVMNFLFAAWFVSIFITTCFFSPWPLTHCNFSLFLGMLAAIRVRLK